MGKQNKLISKIFYSEIDKYDPETIIVGFSGGLDSSLILNLAVNTNANIVAVHINHKININAEIWERHCKEQALKLNISIEVYRLTKCPTGESFEAWARDERLKCFEDVMKRYNNPLLLLGHHLNDQAETFILQALRGAGIAGLSGIQKYKKFKNGYILRPLIDIYKSEIKTYAQSKAVVWIEDDSNIDTKYLRNYVRHEIIPRLECKLPSTIKTLARSADICSSNYESLTFFIKQEIKKIQTKDNELPLKKILCYPDNIKKTLLHLWIKQITQISANHTKIDNIINIIKSESANKKVILNDLFTLITTKNSIKITYLSKDVNLSEYEWLKTYSLDIDYFKIIVRSRLSSDSCRYPGRNKKNKIKILLQELNIENNERKKIKIITYEDNIVAVYPFFVCPEFLVK